MSLYNNSNNNNSNNGRSLTAITADPLISGLSLARGGGIAASVIRVASAARFRLWLIEFPPAAAGGKS